MKVEVSVKNGVTSIELCGSNEKDIAILTDVFGRGLLDRHFRFRARVSNTVSNGNICAVTLNNDAYLSHKYLVSVGFEVYQNHVSKRKGAGTVEEDAGRYYKRGRMIIYNRRNSNLYRVYTNARLEREVLIRGGIRWTVVQIDTSKPATILKYIRKVSELNDLRGYI